MGNFQEFQLGEDESNHNYIGGIGWSTFCISEIFGV